MAEYIKREAVLEIVNKLDDMTALVVGRKVMNLPAADVVPIVRCRECEHWKSSGSKAGNAFEDMEFIGGCEFTQYYRRESDFCSWGKRKEGADNG